MFICNHCPYVKAVEDRLIGLAREFEAARRPARRRCAPTTPNSYPDDAFDKLAARWRERGYGFPYLHDEAQDVARAFGAVCTPDIFVFDRDRRLAYRGPDRRFVEGREPGDAARAGRGARGAGRGQAPVARAAAVDGLLDQMASSLSKNGRLGRKDLKGPWRIVPAAQGPQDDAAAGGDRRRVPASSGHVALEDLLSSRGASTRASAWRRSTGRSSCWRKPASRRRALRAGADAIRDRRGAGAPRSPDL